jgi:hypothetical protein
MWLGGNAPEDLALCLTELLDANSSCSNVDVGLCVMPVTPVAKTPRGRNEFFIACREPAPDASRLGRDLARILLCDATTVVAIFSSLVARLVRSFLQ